MIMAEKLHQLVGALGRKPKNQEVRAVGKAVVESSYGTRNFTETGTLCCGELESQYRGRKRSREFGKTLGKVLGSKREFRVG